MDEKNKVKQLIIKICCVIAAFTLWLYIYNVENPIKDRSITIPVQVVNVESMAQSKLAPIIDTKVNVTLNIRGNATDVTSVEANDFSAEVDLATFVLKKGENKVSVDMKKAPSKVQILNKDSLWVKIIADDIVEKKVPIKVQFEDKVKEGYFALKPDLQASTATISGAAQVVNTVKEAIIKCDLKNSDKDISFKGTLIPINEMGQNVKGVIVEPRAQDITVLVRKVKTVGINVVFKGDISNNPNIKSILPVTDKVEVVLKSDMIDKISLIDTEMVDISNIDGKENLEVKLVLPKDVYLVNNSSTVKLKVSYNKVIQKDISVDVKSINLKSDFEATLVNTKITVTVSGTPDIINNLKPSDIGATLDLANVVEGDNEVKAVLALPQGVLNVGLNPLNIKVVAKKKGGV